MLTFMSLRRGATSVIEHFAEEDSFNRLSGAVLTIVNALIATSLTGAMASLLDVQHTDEGVTISGLAKSSGCHSTYGKGTRRCGQISFTLMSLCS